MPLINPVTMSSTPTKPNSSGSANAATSSFAPLTLPLLAPITLHDTPAARAISYARPIAYLTLLVLRFRSLVDDPVRELQAGLPLVAGVQVAYAVFCLPIAGAEKSKPTRKSRPGERKKTDALGPRPSVVRPDLGSATPTSSIAKAGSWARPWDRGACLTDLVYRALYCLYFLL